MPAIDGTVTAEDVAGWLGVPVTERVTNATAAAIKWATDRRSLTEPETLFYDDAVHLGTVLYAGLTYQTRSTPAGLAGYDEAAMMQPTTAEALYRARDLVGSDPVTA